MDDALIFLLRTLADLFLIVLLLRLFMQWFRVDFRNPVSQAVVRITSPFIVPLRRVLPPVGKIDTATLVVILLFELVFIAVLIELLGGSPRGFEILYYAILRTVMVALRFFFFAILVYVILSWIAPGTYNPVTSLLSQLVNPVLDPARRIIPTIGGLDLSPLLVAILLQAASIAVGSALPGVLH
ncbi:MAG TPA: YggT family protein [Woeseiaceae bacterium]|nr:YggT family protein [Woeseiaceae bacterium]